MIVVRVIRIAPRPDTPWHVLLLAMCGGAALWLAIGWLAWRIIRWLT